MSLFGARPPGWQQSLSDARACQDGGGRIGVALANLVAQIGLNGHRYLLRHTDTSVGGSVDRSARGTGSSAARRADPGAGSSRPSAPGGRGRGDRPRAGPSGDGSPWAGTGRRGSVRSSRSARRSVRRPGARPVEWARPGSASALRTAARTSASSEASGDFIRGAQQSRTRRSGADPCHIDRYRCVDKVSMPIDTSLEPRERRIAMDWPCCPPQCSDTECCRPAAAERVMIGRGARAPRGGRTAYDSGSLTRLWDVCSAPMACAARRAPS